MSSITCRSSLLFNNLWLLNTLLWSTSLHLVDIDFEFNISSLVLETVLSLDNISCILNAEEASVILSILAVLLILVLSLQGLLSVEIGLSLWFSTDVALLFKSCVSSCLSCRSYWAHPFGCRLFDCSLVSLFGKLLLVEVLVQVLLNTLHLSCITLGDFDFLLAWAFCSSSWTLLSTALFVRATNKLDLLINLNWSETDSIWVDVTVRFHSTIDSSISEGVIDL